ncbi:MAG: DUF424 family protein [Nitrososphaeria archaeon]|nr:DUF424 family protein [Nitrososphaeria archaeon]NDB91275.1 DUF424 family protein [Nitrososphaeria archaeon]NDF47189.1 DUF424 family protein [Nitrosopumilaceae archaeon]
MRFFVKTSNYQSNNMLNMCDEDLLGKTLKNGNAQINISQSYYGQRLVDSAEAQMLLQNCSVLNLVGKNTIQMSVDLKIGSQQGVKTIDGVPFLIVFKM